MKVLKNPQFYFFKYFFDSKEWMEIPKFRTTMPEGHGPLYPWPMSERSSDHWLVMKYFGCLGWGCCSSGWVIWSELSPRSDCSTILIYLNRTTWRLIKRRHRCLFYDTRYVTRNLWIIIAAIKRDHVLTADTFRVDCRRRWREGEGERRGFHFTRKGLLDRYPINSGCTYTYLSWWCWTSPYSVLICSLCGGL